MSPVSRRELTRKYSKEHTGNVRIALPEHALQTEGRRPVADYEDYGAGGDAAVDKALRLQAQKQRVKGKLSPSSHLLPHCSSIRLLQA